MKEEEEEVNILIYYCYFGWETKNEVSVILKSTSTIL